MPRACSCGQRSRIPCLVGVHRDRRVHHPDGMTIVSRQCIACGRIKDLNRYVTRGNADGVAYGNVFLSGGH